MRTAALIPIVAAGLATTLALVPPRPDRVERFYSVNFYPILQRPLTGLSNLTNVALFDVFMIVSSLLLIFTWVQSVRIARQKKSPWPVLRGFGSTVTILSVIYLWFVGAWGLNYARPPLEAKLPFDQSRVTPGAVRDLAERAVREANRTYRPAHDAGFPAISDTPPALVEALHAVERDLGRPALAPTMPGNPKHSMLSPYFRAAGVSGMCAPFFLETLLNPDLTGPERPITLAHEWAHLAGFAPESDASFVAYLTALRAGPAAEYSAWLQLVAESVNQLQPVTRELVLKKLAAGPRADQDAIRQRLKAVVRPVERVAWASYDQMLKSQGVEEGVQSYSRVVQLLIGAEALNDPGPRSQDPRQ